MLAAYRDLAGTSLVTHLGIIQETLAVANRRYGYVAARATLLAAERDIALHPIDEQIQREATAAFAAAPTKLSFTDMLSFVFMRQRSLDTALVLDRDFARAGFTCIPR